ncbi:MAG: SMC-Scp complex subunit ScpB [Hydrotalea sp.]|nr:SMC-Scp complex subunit ScpB [Hydrotalea sp.]
MAKEKKSKKVDDAGAPHRIVEAAIFAATAPLNKKSLLAMLPKKPKADIDDILAQLKKNYQSRGIQLLESKDGFYFRTAPDLAPYLTQFRVELKKLSRAAMESLAVIAYHQPITRAEIETIRGVAISKGTLDILFDTGWIKFKGRRKTLGNPITLGTTDKFLVDFGLASLQELPGVEELKEMGLLHLGHDFSSIGMGEEEEDISMGEQLDLLQSSLDDILSQDQNADENENELLMDEPTDEETPSNKSKKKK